MKYYVADAFTDELFKGNPAGICLLDEPVDAALMQSIASENNLAETAFLVRESGGYALRWFTPECEIDLCGHATLASAFVLMNVEQCGQNEIDFFTQSGTLTVRKEKENFVMDFPSRKPVQTTVPQNLDAAIGVKVLEARQSRDLMAVVESEQLVAGLHPDFALLRELKQYFGIIVTAQGTSCDFVSRYFAPNAGILEDPVTGSSHSTLIPFWSERLNKTEMTAKQLSKRGGSLHCKLCGDRVEIGGRAKLYLSGEIQL